MPVPDTFTDGLDNLIYRLQPHGGRSGICCFPDRPDKSVLAPLKVGEGELLHNWFKRCINDSLSGDVRHCMVEPNLAVFATIHWSAGNNLDFANIQVLKTQVHVEDYYLSDKPPEAFYLRLDWDYGTLGPIFTHALPHMHDASFDAAPRFGIDGTWSDNIIMDFFEFVYRHLFHKEWIDWAQRMWRSTRDVSPEGDPFIPIVSAFHESRIEPLWKYAHDIRNLKQSLRRRKDELYPLRVSVGDLELLRYP